MTDLELMKQERDNSGTAWTRKEKFDKVSIAKNILKVIK